MQNLLILTLCIGGAFGFRVGEGQSYYPALPGRYPYVATIMNIDAPLSLLNPICMGTIMHATGQYVLTTCRCRGVGTKINLQQYQVHAGDVNTFYVPSLDTSSTRQMRDVIDWTNHPNCTPNTGFSKQWYFDFSIIKTHQPFVFNAYVNFINLIGDSTILLDRIDYFKSYKQKKCNWCTTLGRTISDYDSGKKVYKKFSNVLIVQKVFVLSDENCTEKLCHGAPETCNWPKDQVHESKVLCAETRSEEMFRICDGDRGAPLICHGRVYGYFMGTPYGQCGYNMVPLIFSEHSDTIFFIEKYFHTKRRRDEGHIAVFSKANRPNGFLHKTIALLHPWISMVKNL